jgi:dihydroneopterin aldolase
MISHNISEIAESTNLTLPTLVLHPFLGVSKEERSYTQPIHVYISLDFLDGLRACHSDDLNDTLCYETLRNNLLEILKLNSFCLIEKLTTIIGQEIEKEVKAKQLGKVRCTICLHKVALPLVEMREGVKFTQAFCFSG